ncbi:DNA-formamidopyrimidine glycosylase family protein [Rhodococcus sp. IEGM 1381]|uniref:DNA-formamidopyrimidine glycosylase family protein n=1 Tax=Rhodococcus sp. IEGM 1381 TaxID=3047085 RepID=UPI0024B75E09|nr:DNA-formamidopyrimidine glycosylase family protein [Rhodococcus sp. IEGM 1381]MDI9894600.1 DNA-formamidopyrimidine glycosylase family protein [Rhodococcus sp. IEGM 1381]
MPEGDTVFALAARLRRALDGATLRAGRLNVPAHAVENLAGRTVVAHRTHGKHLFTDFDDGTTLHTHLRMSGSWTVVRAGRSIPQRVRPDVRVQLAVADGPTAYGILLPVVDYGFTPEMNALVAHLGPDPLQPMFDTDTAVANVVAQMDRPIIATLLDQRVIAGPGNLWANELCFLRGLWPWTRSNDVDAKKLVALLERAMRHSVAIPGAMQVTTGDVRRGRSHWVAGRAGKPCLRCGTLVRVAAEVPGDPDRRRTWWCPRCQPEH